MSGNHATAWLLCCLDVSSTKQTGPLLFKSTLLKTKPESLSDISCVASSQIPAAYASLWGHMSTVCAILIPISSLVFSTQATKAQPAACRTPGFL